MAQRRDGGRPADAGPAAVVVAAVAVLALAGCGTGSQPPVSIGPGPGGAEGCVFESGTEVCATGAGSSGPSATGTPSATPADPSPSTSSSPTPSRSATRSTGGTAWGGGRRVGSYRTTGTVRGAQGAASDQVRVDGTCDVARDVRTVTAKLDPTSTLVIAVTGRNVASVTLRVRGGTTWQVDYVGPTADDVATLTPTRTRVAGARLVRVSGPAAAPVTVDADFDC